MGVRNAASDLLADLEESARQASSATALMRTIGEELARRMPSYNWVGFYMLDPADANMLVLGPSAGADTPHKRIPLDQGICGAAASSGKTIVVDDVRADPRYLACSLETRSEIVAPVWVRGRVAGELDIDSHSATAFGPEDRELVEACAALVGRYIESTSA